MIDLQVLGGGDREHAINSKKVDVKRARAKPGTVNLPVSELFSMHCFRENFLRRSNHRLV